MGHRSGAAERLMGRRVRALTRALPAAREGDPAAVHKARVATRRLREALPLVESGRRRRKLRETLRRLRRALGPLRELDVALDTVDALAADAPRAAVTRLQRALRQERRRLYAAMRRELAQVDAEKLGRRAVAAARRCRGIDAAAHAARRAMRLRSAIDHAGGIYLGERLHQVRIAVKKLRYALELARDVGGSRAAARLRRLEAAQDLLGRMQDFEMLTARIRAVQGSSQAPTLSLSGDLDRLVRRLETECRQLHGHYIAMRSGLLALCAQVAPDRRRRGRGARLSSAA
jgi:CHAD domain-containing protein